MVEGEKMISVVIPTYNEEESVIPLYEELVAVIPRLGKTYEIIFVDDGSTDSTFQRLHALHEEDARVKIVKFRSNFGQSAALKAGFDHASGDIIITMDADLQNDPQDIPQMIEQLERDDLDVVCGWRYNRRDPFFKRFVSKGANRLRRALTDETVHDSGCTLRIYKRACIKDLDLYGELHRYIPAMLKWKGYKVGEIKTNHRERKLGTTKYNWKRLFKGFLDLIVVTFWQKYSLRPIHIFGGAGLLMGIVGSVITLYLVMQRLFFGMSLSDRPLFLVGIFFVLVGVQFIATGLLADIVVKIYYGQKDRKNYLVERVVA